MGCESFPWNFKEKVEARKNSKETIFGASIKIPNDWGEGQWEREWGKANESFSELRATVTERRFAKDLMPKRSQKRELASWRNIFSDFFITLLTLQFKIRMKQLSVHLTFRQNTIISSHWWLVQQRVRCLFYASRAPGPSVLDNPRNDFLGKMGQKTLRTAYLLLRQLSGYMWSCHGRTFSKISLTIDRKPARR